MIAAMADNSESCRGRGTVLSNVGGGRRERRFGGVCAAGTRVGGRLVGTQGWVLVNKGCGFPAPQTLEGIGPRRTVLLLLLMLKRGTSLIRNSTPLMSEVPL